MSTNLRIILSLDLFNINSEALSKQFIKLKSSLVVCCEVLLQISDEIEVSF